VQIMTKRLFHKTTWMTVVVGVTRDISARKLDWCFTYILTLPKASNVGQDEADN
jgi:hypothetical protein